MYVIVCRSEFEGRVRGEVWQIYSLVLMIKYDI